MAIDRIFGYGSLIWKPPPHAIDRLPCYVKGYKRRFAQLSHDHRGTPEKPGIVVTLVPDSEWLKLEGSGDYPSSLVWGVMYTIDPTRAEEVQTYLDEREQDGYETAEVDVFVVKNGQEQWAGKSTMYLGHVTNPSFYRHAKLAELATHIHISAGPSGTNKEYLYHLKEQIEALAPQSNDPYLQDLEAHVRKLDEGASPHESKILVN